MTMHPSLHSGDSKKGHRSVLKRFERLSILKDKEKWDENKSVFGLPKVKTLKVKIKKEKAATPQVAVAGAETTAAPAAATGTKAAAPQAAPAKKEEKKK